MLFVLDINKYTLTKYSLCYNSNLNISGKRVKMLINKIFVELFIKITL